MRVIRRNQNVLKVRPASSVGLFVLALSFLGIGIVSLFIFGRTVALVCERPTAENIRCRLQESLFGVPLKDAPLEALSGAMVQSYVDSEGDTIYEVVVHTGRGERSLPGASSMEESQCRHTVEQINTFVQDNSRPTLEVRSRAVVEKLLGVIFILSGIGGFLWALNSYMTVWTFDQERGVALCRAVRLNGVKTARYPLREIVGVGLGLAPNSTQGEAYRVELVLSSGRRIPLIQSYSSGLSKKEKAVRLLRDFLDL
jgi:hypothetical protein